MGSRGVLGTFVVLIGGCTGRFAGAASQINKDKTEVNDDSVSRGIGWQDATADVGTPTPPDSIGYATVQIPVTNNSSGRSNCWMDVATESRDGTTQLETSTAFVSDLEPGQSTTAESMPINTESFPSGAVAGITKVERNASY